MAFTVMLSVIDEKGKTSTTEVKLPTATVWADAVIMAQQIALLIDPLILGAITRVGVTADVELPVGLAASASANSDVEEGARFQFRTENGFYTGLRLPTFDESLIVAGTRGVDLTDTDVAAFVAAMEDGIDTSGYGGTDTVEPCDARDEDIVSLEFAREQFLSSRG
ncbi:MAG: hypothetical protein M5R40_15810 [Anaerolineae bacterium]|nr:hypothetical protein [Anaerolineae bacterium]